jgi:hypothetical protein
MFHPRYCARGHQAELVANVPLVLHASENKAHSRVQDRIDVVRTEIVNSHVVIMWLLCPDPETEVQISYHVMCFCSKMYPGSLPSVPRAYTFSDP